MAFLIAGGMTAASFLWTIEQRGHTSVTTQAETSARLARMSETIAGIGAAQQSYIAPGQLDEPWFERTAALLGQLSIDIDQAPVSLRSPESAAAMQALADAADALADADARTRQNLGLGQDLMASDVIFSDGRNIVGAMIARLRDLQAAEQASHQAELAALASQRWIAFGAAAALWVVGFLVLARIPATTRARATARETAAMSRPLPAESPAVPRARLEQGAPLDLPLIAALCTDLSRLTTTAALPGLLGRVATVLDASGVILWISAGEQLFPVVEHGYGRDVLARLTPVARGAENAAAAAWRAGQLTVVRSTGPTDNGAIVAPLFGLHACLGVLAAEVRHGAEDNPATQALATMIAAQLATVVPAWPAGSLTRPAGAPSAADPSPVPEKATLAVRSA